MTPSDLSWAGWSTFLAGRGFERRPRLPRPAVHAAALVVGRRGSLHGGRDAVDCIDDGPARPVLPDGVDDADAPSVRADARRARCSICCGSTLPDDYDLDRYLNVLHETDRQLGRLFDGLRARRPRPATRSSSSSAITGRRSATRTTGNYMQGRIDVRGGRPRAADAVVSADVRRRAALERHRRPCRSGADDRRVRRACRRPPDWQGRSLFDDRRAPARVLLCRRRSLQARRPRGPTGSTSTTCAKASRSSTISIAIRTSSTTWPRRSRR